MTTALRRAFYRAELGLEKVHYKNKYRLSCREVLPSHPQNNRQMSLFDKLNKAKMDKLKANLEEGLSFLEENKKRPEVTALQSGLQYEVIAMGEGPKPAAINTVTCHYHGMLIDGRVFDSSVQRGQPASFPLNRVISGWTEALQLMPIGSKWKLFLPPHLAYGEQQAGPLIGPNSTLIFEVELLGF